MAFIEDDFGIVMADADIVPQNLDSLARISAFIEAKAAVPVSGVSGEGRGHHHHAFEQFLIRNARGKRGKDGAGQPIAGGWAMPNSDDLSSRLAPLLPKAA